MVNSFSAKINAEYLQFLQLFANNIVINAIRVIFGYYDSTVDATNGDRIIVSTSFPSIDNSNIHCKRFVGHISTSFALRMCIKTNPNGELLHELLSLLKTKTEYSNMFTGEAYTDHKYSYTIIHATKIISLEVL